MQTKTQKPGDAAAGARRAPRSPLNLNEGLTGKKTALIVLTVVGCIAILWPKVFYPMMFGDVAPKPDIKEQRGAACCGVVINREQFLNATPLEFGPQLYHKQLSLLAGDINYPGGVRQERPVHLHPDSIYQAMRERGRAIIPSTPTVPLVERKGLPTNARLVEGRPGPIPGMRPPMGSGQVHQPQQPKGSASMGFIMPLYTIGIILFFGYTIMKVTSKKPVPNAPYGPAPTDSNFRKEVFGQENGRHVEDLGGTKLGTNLTNTTTASTTKTTNTSTPRNGSELYNASLSAATAATNLSSSLKQHQHHHQYQQQQQQQKSSGPAKNTASSSSMPAAVFNRETEQLMEIDKLRRKLEETEKSMAKLIAEMNSDQFEAKKSNENSTSKKGDISNGHTASLAEHEDDHITHISDGGVAVDTKSEHQKIKRSVRGDSKERTVAVLGMEVTASCEGGQKWTGRPPTPVFLSHNEHSHDHDDDMPAPQEIYLEGALAHESKILISDAGTTTQEVYDEELNGSPEEPAVVLSSKMTLSLINLDAHIDNNKANSPQNEIESPLADDIEIIGHDEN